MEEQEINLMDYIKTVMRRWRMILAITAAATLLTFLVSFLSPKIYEVSTIIEVGTLDTETKTMIEPPAKIKEKVESSVYEVIGAKTEIPAGINLVKIYIESGDINGAKTALEKINNSILAEHHKLTALQKEIIEQQIEKNRAIYCTEN